MIAIVPLAGRGSRFSNHGYEIPKPLIHVGGKPMILRAIDSLSGIKVSSYIFIALKEHEDQFHLRELLSKNVNAKTEFVFLEEVTEGQLCTVLKARDLMHADESVLIASSDTLVISDLAKDIENTRWDGIISVANLPGDQWSFARTNSEGSVVEVAEKKRISDNASTGLYFFRRAKDLISFGEEMIRNKETTRGEYYIIPVYQKLINVGLSVGISKANAMWDMGTPEAKEHFEKNYLQK